MDNNVQFSQANQLCHSFELKATNARCIFPDLRRQDKRIFTHLNRFWGLSDHGLFRPCAYIRIAPTDILNRAIRDP